MIEINLLPWREHKRHWKKKRTNIILSGITLGLVGTIFLMHVYALSLVSKQSQHNQQLREEITRFAPQIQEINKLEEEKKSLISRIIIMQHLALTRILLVHLFNELLRVMPDDVYLSRVKKVSDRITLTGYSATSHSIVSLIRNLEQNSLVKAPVLIEIKKNRSEKMSGNHELTINFNLQTSKCVYISQNE